jgi:hypothetical protein
MTQNMILMGICTWRMIWMHRTALIEMAMWTWDGTVKMREMKRGKMRRRKMRWRRRWWMRLRRRMRMRIIAKNVGQLARERW